MGMTGINNFANEPAETQNANETSAPSSANIGLEEFGHPSSPQGFRERMERIRENGRENAYKKGVNEVSDYPVVFVDPDKLDGDTPAERGQQLAEILDDFHPDAKESLLNTLNSFPGSNGQVTLEDVAKDILESGPAALPEAITVDGQVHGLAIVPSNDLDTKEELVRVFLGSTIFDQDQIDAIVENTPGSDKEWMRLVGNHEGEHMNSGLKNRDTIETLQNETVADEEAIARAQARNDGDVAQALKDIRALSADQYDIEHSTGALINSGDEASVVHAEVAENYIDIMMDIVNNDDEVLNSSDYAEDLLKDDPEKFFAILNRNIEANTKETMDAYNANPTSNEAIGNAVVLQTFTTYANDFEGAYRRLALGQEDFPVNQPAQLVPQEVEEQYYEYAAHQARVESEINELSFEGMLEFVPEDHFGNFDWENYEGQSTTAYDLKVNDPQAYFDHVDSVLGEIKTELVEKYNQDPSYENAENLIKLEAIYANQYAQRNMVADFDSSITRAPDAPDIISDKDTQAHIDERIKREDYVPDPNDTTVTVETVPVEPKERGPFDPRPVETPNQATPDNADAPQAEAQSAEPTPAETTQPETEAPSHPPAHEINNRMYSSGVDGTAYTTQVGGLETGEPNVDFENGVTVGGMTMGNVFAQSANPDPENVTMVNAKVETTPDVDPALLAAQQQQPEMSAQTLGR